MEMEMENYGFLGLAALLKPRMTGGTTASDDNASLNATFSSRWGPRDNQFDKYHTTIPCYSVN